MRAPMARPNVRRERPAAPSGMPRLLAVIIFGTALLALLRALWTPPPASEGAAPPATASARSLLSIFFPTPTPSPSPTPNPTAPVVLPVGIVAGHWGNDSGAVCDSGIREVDVNLAVAQRVVAALRAAGYPTDLLEEFDPRLTGYRARALVSIHADACLYPEASGFKVARVEASAIPEVEDRLVDCLIRHYQARTGLPFHEGSITRDMTEYHAFYEIAPSTPGAIIEIGFLLADRDMLLHHQDLVAQGIVEGILCFLEGETP